MNPYILLSLWANDDEATRVSHAFAMEFHKHRGAVRLLHGDNPSAAELRAAANDHPEAPIVIFAHGGAALSARRDGNEWLTAEALAASLSGRRVYAFACSTFVPQRELLLSTFANNTVAACVAVFAGHEAPVMAPFVTEENQTRGTQRMKEALFKLIDAFADGEDDAAELRSIGRMEASIGLEIELDLPSEDSDQGGFGWSSEAFLRGFFGSLQVLTKNLDGA